MMQRYWMALLAVVLLTACSSDPPPATLSAPFDLEPFRALASESICADEHNAMVLIDSELVYWDIAGSCSDAAYSQILYGSSPEQRLCIHHDSIAGPVLQCDDESYRELFETIIAHREEADLGLGPDHKIEQIY